MLVQNALPSPNTDNVATQMLGDGDWSLAASYPLPPAATLAVRLSCC